MKPVGLLAIYVLVAFTLSACGGQGDDEKRDAGAVTDERRGTTPHSSSFDEESLGRERQGPSARTRRNSGRAIMILKPTDGQTVHGGAVTVAVSIRGFDVVKPRVRPPFPPPVPGEGHVHFYLDTQTLPTTHSPPMTGTYRSLSTTTATWAIVGPGRHSFAAQLVGKDHVPLSPPVKDQVTVAVE